MIKIRHVPIHMCQKRMQHMWKYIQNIDSLEFLSIFNFQWLTVYINFVVEFTLFLRRNKWTFVVSARESIIIIFHIFSREGCALCPGQKIRDWWAENGREILSRRPVFLGKAERLRNSTLMKYFLKIRSYELHKKTYRLIDARSSIIKIIPVQERNYWL